VIVLPNLIHPVPVFLRKAEKALTAVQDDNLHEPVGQVRRQQAPTRFLAQVSWGKDQRQDQVAGGAASASDGYLLFRPADLRGRHFEIEVGDCIVQIGEGNAARSTDLYVVALTWMGHYPDQNGASLVRAYFEDRSPSRASRGSTWG
jgi:hypothetical protein